MGEAADIWCCIKDRQQNLSISRFVPRAVKEIIQAYRKPEQYAEGVKKLTGLTIQLLS